ncbi:MATE family efflux transporter [Enterococcus faecium]|nr:MULTISPECIES: MATE family efflux transporter [Bacillota]MBJ0795872.1 MATE family efflux transporter [Enterococcus faecium]HES0992130.1 MATE family efflux transporter [Streptococcus pyogenes]MCC2716677.1 MATE family efflux transporter [Finegoldia magna]MDU2897309.1 MATE family efflux transporter [Finegoldia magna]MDU5275491.1 MATE family efflux transporter [Peptoniphilus lacydonensis]
MNNNRDIEKIKHENLLKLIIEMAIPSALSMIIIIMYGITDTYFVSQIGVNEVAAVGISFSFMNVIQAFGLLYGHGSGNYISRMQGKKKYDESEKMSITGFYISLTTGLLILLFSILFFDNLVLFLGAKGELIFTTKSYLRILLLSTPFAISSLTLNNQLRLQGKPKVGALAMIVGAVINCIFDPIFIFGFNLGIKGAAYATFLGQIISFIVLVYYAKFKNDIQFNRKNFSIEKYICSELFMGGLPNFSREIFIAISIVVLNNTLSFYGKSYIAAFTIVSKLIQAGTYVMVGFGHGFQPICGINFGAGLNKRVIKAFKITLYISVSFVIVLGIIFICSSEFLISLFTLNREVISIGNNVLKLQSLTLPLVAYITISGMFLQNTHKFKMATIVTMSRQGIIYIPCIYFLNLFYGVYGVYFAQGLSDIITIFITVYFVRKNIHILSNNKEKYNCN